jgi:hypothetical protein
VLVEAALAAEAAVAASVLAPGCREENGESGRMGGETRKYGSVGSAWALLGVDVRSAPCFERRSYGCDVPGCAPFGFLEGTSRGISRGDRKGQRPTKYSDKGACVEEASKRGTHHSLVDGLEQSCWRHGRA